MSAAKLGRLRRAVVVALVLAATTGACAEPEAAPAPGGLVSQPPEDTHDPSATKAAAARLSEQQEVAEAIQRYHRSVAERDGKRACQQMTEDRRDEVEDESNRTCAKAMEVYGKSLRDGEREAFEKVTVRPGRIWVNDDMALVYEGAFSYQPEVRDDLRVELPRFLINSDEAWLLVSADEADTVAKRFAELGEG